MKKRITRDDLINDVIKKPYDYEYMIYAKKTHKLYDGEPGQFLFWQVSFGGIAGIDYNCGLTKELDAIYSKLVKFIDKANGGEKEQGESGTIFGRQLEMELEQFKDNGGEE